MTTNKWHHVQTFDEYYDFNKELFSMPDDGNTSVDMRMTFNTENRTCSYGISLHNDSGNTIDWERSHHLPWATGIEMLGDEVEIPKELTEATITV
jgi:hypothetical protein